MRGLFNPIRDIRIADEEEARPARRVSFFVPGVPATAGSKRGFYNQKLKRVIMVDDCGRSKDWRGDVIHFATAAHQEAPLEGPLFLHVTFGLARPKGHFGSGRNAGRIREGAPLYPTTKPDCTKMLRALEDALTGVLWKDDAQIVEQVVHKEYNDRPGAQVTVEEMP